MDNIPTLGFYQNVSASNPQFQLGELQNSWAAIRKKLDTNRLDHFLSGQKSETAMTDFMKESDVAVKNRRRLMSQSLCENKLDFPRKRANNWRFRSFM